MSLLPAFAEFYNYRGNDQSLRDVTPFDVLEDRREAILG